MEQGEMRLSVNVRLFIAVQEAKRRDVGSLKMENRGSLYNWWAGGMVAAIIWTTG